MNKTVSESIIIDNIKYNKSNANLLDAIKINVREFENACCEDHIVDIIRDIIEKTTGTSVISFRADINKITEMLNEVQVAA